MFGTIARVALMRVLPRKVLPVLTAWQVISMIRGRKNNATSVDRSASRRSRSR
jgi:hypothetical protein